MNVDAALRRRAREAKSWLFDASYPLWSREGVNAATFAEALDLGHARLAGETSRVRVQARQTYVFATAERQGWKIEDARELTEFGLDILNKQCRRPDELYGRVIKTDGSGLEDDTADLYDTAFALLAFSTAALNGDETDALNALPQAISSELSHAAGGYRETIPVPEFRLQNPHMHLFEAFLGLMETKGIAEHREIADQIESLCLEHFFDANTGTLGERFNQDWTTPDGDAGDVVEPGHHFEWVWLLNQYARLRNSAPPEVSDQLYGFAVSTLDEEGRAVQEVRRNGARHDSSRRTWPQTEALKAHLTMWQRGDERAGERAINSFDILMDEYLTPEGGWIDHYSGDGQVLSKTMPASTLYHIVGAFEFLMDVAET
ncbi:MAG: AGE family epimerase/isomerase [Pseudomonadota bacterium]